MGRVLSPSPSSPQKSSVIIFFMLVQSRFVTYNRNMYNVLLYSGFFIAILALFFGLYALGRVAKVTNAMKDLDWDSVANITGDLATLKKTIQTLNNRINGMHSPKIQEQELLAQLLQNKTQQKNGKIIGG